MIANVPLTIVNLFFTGLLAGEEVTMRFAIRAPLRHLAPHAHIRMRQDLVRTLRVLVPIIFAGAIATGIVQVWIDSFADINLARQMGVGVLIAFIALTLASTVPINQAILGWDPGRPPAGWMSVIDRWELLDTIRTVLATVAFVLFLVAST